MMKAFTVLLALTAPALAQAPVIGQGGAAPGPPLVFQGSHAIVGGPPVTVDHANAAGDGCGAAPFVRGTDTAGSINFPADANPATFCVLKFAVPYAQNPFCQVQVQDTNELLSATGKWSVSTTNIFLRGFVAFGIVTWQCFGSGT
jgi:hypothetical protein